MILKNLRHHLKLRWQLLKIIYRYDVLVEKSVTIKYADSISFGSHCTLQSGVYVYGSLSGNEVRFGDYIAISSGCVLLGGGSLELGSYTHLGPGAVITTQYGDSRSNMQQADVVLKYAPVKLGKACWIGSGAVIMPGTVLGDCSIVAPNSVVYGVWGDNSELSGNPARPKKSAPNKTT